MEFKHLMVDIETLGTDSYAAILSIAAVEFNIMTGETGDHFYRTIDLQSCVDAGLRIQPKTIMWWLNQSPEALKASTINTDNLAKVLLDFSLFCKHTPYEIWGNSNRFDLGLLHNAYEVINMSIPWDFRKERDVRTLVAFNPEIKKQHQWSGTAHDPLDDCFNQISYCSKIWNLLTSQIK